MLTGDSSVRDWRRAAAAALVCLLVAAGQRRGVSAAPPAIQNTPHDDRTNSILPSAIVEDVCAVSLQLGRRSDGGQHVTVAVPERCGCNELELSVLQKRGIPCPPSPGYRCSWMTSHRATSVDGAADFLVSVGGKFRPVARCKPPQVAGEGSQRRRAGRLLVGQPETLGGIDLLSWNTSIAAKTDGQDLVVTVVRQMDGAHTDAYFPELFITLYRPPQDGESRHRRVAYQREPFTPEGGTRANFTDAAPGGLIGYRVDVRPAGSWVCQGANDGCQRRYANVIELLELTAQARENPGIEA